MQPDIELHAVVRALMCTCTEAMHRVKEINSAWPKICLNKLPTQRTMYGTYIPIVTYKDYVQK